jgi:hypothetical protein
METHDDPNILGDDSRCGIHWDLRPADRSVRNKETFTEQRERGTNSMTATSHMPDLRFDDPRAALKICRYCRMAESDHATQGAWCPNPQGPGRLWLGTQFQPLDPSIPRFDFQAPDALGLTDRDCRLILAFLIGWFKQPGVSPRSSEEFTTAMNLALQGNLR